MKLKGYSLKLKKKQYTLKEQLSEGGFSMIYETNYPEIICKVQVLTNSQIQKAYHQEKEMLTLLQHPNIVKLYDSAEITFKDDKFGLLFLENCNSGTVFNILEKYELVPMPEKKLIKILIKVASVVEYLHQNGVSHRDIKMENVLINSEGELKLCDFGSSSTQVIYKVDSTNRVEIQEHIEKTTTPLYRSPQQLDLYSGYEIGTKVDVFALGVMTFILCFKKPPFEARLSAINKQYFIPEDNNYSEELVSIIESCFTTSPVERPNASTIRKQLIQLLNKKIMQVEVNLVKEIQQTHNEISRIKEGSLKTTELAESTFFQKMKRIYNQITTQTQGWLSAFIEDSEESPLLKYNRSIISKCYEKRYKIEKVYELISKYSEEYKGKCLVILKLLVLLHNFLRKGPKEVISFEQNQYRPMNICTKIYKEWKNNQKIVSEEDIKRNSFVCLMIRFYSLILISKLKLCYEHSHLFEANYSLLPYLEDTNRHIILKLPIIQALIVFLQNIITFHQQVQKVQYIREIQKMIVLSVVDEEYCAISTLIFLFAAFKNGVAFIKEEIDREKLYKKIYYLEARLETIYKQLNTLFKKASEKYTNIFEDTKFQLNLNVLKFIKNISMQSREGKFIVTDYLNYQKNIYGLTIPMTYEEVVKNPNFLKEIEKKEVKENLFEVGGQFKVSKKKEEKKVQEKVIEQNKSNFTKPKAEKDKVFENFSFESNNSLKKKIEQHNKSSNLMEFTHQNLNKDFLSTNNFEKEKHSDQFRDFLSIVDNKFEQEKSFRQKQNIIIASNTSKEVFASDNKSQIKKIELMNFFDDDEEEPPKIEQPIKTVPLIEFEEKQSSKSNGSFLKIDSLKLSNNVKEEKSLIKFEDDKASKTSPSQLLFGNAESKIKSQKKLLSEIQPQEKSPQRSTKSNSNSYIDLKEFIVEEVKKNAEQYVIEFNNLIFKQKVGYGNSSQVFRGEWRGREVAIKKIKQDMNTARSEKEFKREIMTSVKIRHHPQLVTLIGVSQHQNYHYIINQFCNGSTLFDLLHESSDSIPWKVRISIAKQIARGMVFLHTNDPPIIHRDLKSLNVLLTHQYDPTHPDLIQIKIADFGLSRDYASTYMTGTLGTYHWMAPQIFNNEPYTLKADVYSYGVVLWEIASRCPPYTNMKNPQSLMKFITVENGRPDLSLIDSSCPVEMRMLMVRCWDRHPENRPNFNEILLTLENIN